MTTANQNFWRINWRKKTDTPGYFYTLVCGTEKLAQLYLERLLKDKNVETAFIGDPPPPPKPVVKK